MLSPTSARVHLTVQLAMLLPRSPSPLISSYQTRGYLIYVSYMNCATQYITSCDVFQLFIYHDCIILHNIQQLLHHYTYPKEELINITVCEYTRVGGQRLKFSEGGKGGLKNGDLCLGMLYLQLT